ncbi:MAG: hypothetical protein Q7S76_00460 [bacterium]|nr:hypothetical protein [bacterium]
MEVKNRDDKYVRTSSLPLATFLFACEQKIAGIRPLDGKKREIVFVKTPRLEELVDKFKFGERGDKDVLVDARLHERARQELLDRVHE